MQPTTTTIASLDPREFRAAALYLYGHMTQQMIATEMSLSQQTISRLLAAAKPKLERLGITFRPAESPHAEAKRRTRAMPSNLPWL